MRTRFITAATLAATAAAHADILYGQPLNDTHFGGVVSNARQSERHAQGFMLAEGALADRVRWWGFGSGGDNVTGFDLRFYASDGPDDGPGTLLHEQTFAAADLSPQFSRTLAGWTEYAYTATLAAPVPIPAGDWVYLHIGGITESPTHDFIWSRASTTSGRAATDAFGPG